MNSSLRYLSQVLIIVSIILFGVQLADVINFTIDDTFIPLRIVDNFVTGKGLVYTEGEFVEGHSDPLWVLILSAFRYLFVNESSSTTLLIIAKSLNLAFGLGTIALTYSLVIKIFKNYQYNILFGSVAVFLLSTNTYFIAWSVAGLETTLTSFLYVLALLIIANPIQSAYSGINQQLQPKGILRHVMLSVTLFLAALTRPETPLVAGFIYLYLLMMQRDQRKMVLFGLVTYLIMLGIFVAWRYTYYGDVLPNSFYSKTGTSFGTLALGFKYAAASLGSLLGPLMVLIPAVLFRKPHRTNPYWLYLGLLGINIVFVVYAGGDWMPGFRLMLPVFPMMIIVSLIIILSMINNININIHGKWRMVATVLSVVVVGTSLLFASRTLIRGQLPDFISGYNRVTWYTDTDHEGVAHWLKENTEPGEVVAFGEAGLMGYLNPHLKLLDLNGLFDKKIALDRKHRRAFDADYIFDKGPDFIVLFSISKETNRNVVYFEDYYRTLYNDARLDQQYERRHTSGLFTIYSKRGLKH